MKTVILAAGIASRLKPLTDNTPKCLLKVAGKCILERTIENLTATGNLEIIIVTGYLENQIREFVSKRFPELNVTYICNQLYRSTNNIYSLWMAKEAVANDSMIMMDSDIVFDKDIITRLVNSGYSNCLALKRHNVQDEEIKVKADKSGMVLAINKEILISEAIGESIGIELFSREGCAELFRILDRKVITDKKINVFYETAFEELAENHLYVVDTTDLFCMEIDTADDLSIAQDLVRNNINQKIS
jgi:choline kinase